MSLAKVVIKGVRESVAKQERKARRHRKKADRASANAMGAVVAKAQKRLAPVDSGTLRRSIGKRAKATKDGALAIAGPRRRFKAEVDGRVRQPTKYAHLAEKESSFMARAAAASKAEAEQKAADAYRKNMEKK